MVWHLESLFYLKNTYKSKEVQMFKVYAFVLKSYNISSNFSSSINPILSCF